MSNGTGSYYNTPGPRQYITKKAVKGDKSGLVEVISEIENKSGFNVDIDVYESSSEENCFATTGKGGSRLLIADLNFLNEVNNLANTQWAAISVIAHEVGHHIAGFNHNEKQSDDELEADYWSGYILKKLGASKNASIKCIMKFGTEQDTESHPNKYSRAEMIKKGWDDSNQGTPDYSKCQDCNPGH